MNGAGRSGAQVQQQGSDLINVTVPGKAAQEVIKLVSTTAQLSVRPVYLESPSAPGPRVQGEPLGDGNPEPAA